MHSLSGYPRLLWFILICSLARAQECTRVVPISVLHGNNGRQIDPLTPQQLHARAGRIDLPVTGVEKFTAGRVLVLADLSASMEKAAGIVQHMGPALVQNAPPTTRVAFGFFHDKIVISPGFSADPGDLAPVIEQARAIKANGKTLMLDAIHQGLQLFRDPAPGDAIVIITDGGENISKTKPRAGIEELRLSGVRLFWVIVAPESMIPEEQGQRWLADAVEDSGGASFRLLSHSPIGAPPQSKKELNAALLNLWQQGILRGYSVRITIPGELRKPEKWKLALAAGGDKHLKDASLYYPRYLEPCAAANQNLTTDQHR